MKGSILRVSVRVFAKATLAALWFNNASAEDWTPLWSTASLSAPRSSLSATSADGMAFFAGGYYAGKGYINVVNIYNAASGTWSTATLSQARYRPSAASANGEVFFAGGTAMSGYSNVVDIYNTATGVWSTASLSGYRADNAATSVGGKVLFGGGWMGGNGYSNAVDIYDTASSTWSTGQLSQGRYALSAASASGEAFFGGGDSSTGASNVVDIYNAASGTWSTAQLSQARWDLAAASANGMVLFGGGWTGSACSNVVDIYNTATGVWSTASLSQPREWLSAASVGNRVFFAGGETNGGGYSNVVDIYNTTNGAWSTATLSQARGFLSATSAGNQVLFGGGYGGTPSNTVDIYTLQSYLSITSTKTFALQDNTTVAGLMQLTGGSLGLGNYNLAVGSMSGTAPINLGLSTLTVGTDNTSTTYSGTISGTGNLIKIGTSSLVLAASNTYAGPTTISQGKLILDGGLKNSVVTVNASGILAGTGSLTSVTVNAGGQLAPGNPPGALNLSGTLALAAGAAMNYQLDTPSTSSQVLMPSGQLVLSGQQFTDFNFMWSTNFGPGSYDLIDAGSILGSLGSNASGTIDGYAATLAVQSSGSNQDLVLNVTPEPGTLALLGAGTIGLLSYGLRRRAARRTANPAAFAPQDAPAILCFPSPSSPAHAARRAA